MSYAGADPRIPSSFDVEVSNVATGTTVLSRTLSQPGDIPDVAAMPDEVRAVLTAERSYARPLPEGGAGLFLLNGATFAQAVAQIGGKHLPVSSRAMYPDDPAQRPYGPLDVLVVNGALRVPGLGAMGAFTDFSAAQRELLLQFNRERNGGTIRSDDPDDPCPVLDPRGAANAPEIDHIIPKVLGGSNYFSNARVVSWQLNNKEDRIKPISELVDVSRLSTPTLPSTIDARANLITVQWLAHYPKAAEVAPTSVRGWITTRWPALGPEGVSPRLLKAVMAGLAQAGVKPVSKLGPTKGITKPRHMKARKNKHVRKPRSRHGVR